MICRAMLAALTATFMQFVLMSSSKSSPSNPTIEYSQCDMSYREGDKYDKIEPDDFIAICGGGGAIGKVTFKTTWRKYIAMCRLGHYPDIWSDNYNARGSYYHKGKLISTEIDCDKVFHIAQKYGVITASEAESGIKEWKDAYQKGMEFIAKLEENEKSGDWRSRFLLTVAYLRLEPSVLRVNKYDEGERLARKLARDGHGKPLIEYLRHIDENNKPENGLGRHDKIFVSLQFIIKSLADDLYGPAAYLRCERAVKEAVRIISAMNMNDPEHRRESQENAEKESVRTVRYACDKAKDIVGEDEKKLLSNLVSEVEALHKSNDRKKAVAKQKRDEALYSILAIIGAAILSGHDNSGSERDVSAERREANRQQCLQTQSMATWSGDATMMGAAHLVPCM